MSLENIDPALGLLAQFGKENAAVSRPLQTMRESALLEDTLFTARQKCLMAALWGISTRCEPCLKFYVIKAKSLGATLEELNEVLSIAVTMGGCVGEMWALKAYHAYHAEASGDLSCCDLPNIPPE